MFFDDKPCCVCYFGQLSVTKDFSLSLNVPSYLIRGEEIVLEVNIVNHLDRDLEVWHLQI